MLNKGMERSGKEVRGMKSSNNSRFTPLVCEGTVANTVLTVSATRVV